MNGQDDFEWMRHIRRHPWDRTAEELWSGPDANLVVEPDVIQAGTPLELFDAAATQLRRHLLSCEDLYRSEGNQGLNDLAIERADEVARLLVRAANRLAVDARMQGHVPQDDPRF